MRKTIRGATLAFAFAALVIIVAPSTAGATRPALAPDSLNPAFVQALRNHAASRSERMPNPVKMHLGAAAAARAVRQAVSLPAQYDLRALNEVTAVRDQGSLGACWAFANIGALESRLLVANLADKRNFSEDNLITRSGFGPFSWSPGDLYNSGGWDAMAVAYFARWAGPVYDWDDRYDTPVVPLVNHVRRHVQDVVMLPGRSGPLDNDLIKQLVITDGAISVGMFYSPDFDSWDGVNAATATYYCNLSLGDWYQNEPVGENHGVDIVGWDDTFSKTNFTGSAVTPPGDGAFLVRNSWGTSYGDKGYFWVSYYDRSFAYGDTTAYAAVQSASNYTRNYQYDKLGLVDTLRFKSALNPTRAWFANRFTAKANGKIAALGFYATSANTTYTLYAGPSLANLTARGSGTLALPGYYTVGLSTRLRVYSGKKFVVAVRVTTPSANPVPIERPVYDYSNQATASPGQSFIRPGWSHWYDLTSYGGIYKRANVCLKAFAQ